jgi:membrane AbrB-like protein
VRQTIAVLGTLALAALGGGLAIVLHVPAGGIIGALVLVSVVSLTTGRVPQLPPRLQRTARILTGTVIGSGVGPHLLEGLGDFWLPALLLAGWTIVVAMSLGYWVHRRTGLDLGTALFSFAPGGMTEMVMVAQDLGADVRLVSLIALLRMLSTVTLVPRVLGYLVLRH